MVDYVSAYTGAEIDVRLGRVGEQVFGWQDYQDTATASSPIALTNAGEWYDLTNDGLGPLSSTVAKYPGHSEIYNTSTNLLSFSDLSLLDKINIRFDVEFTTAGPNHRVWVRVVFGPSFVFSLPLGKETHKTAVSGEEGRMFGAQPFYMYTNETLSNPAKFQAMSDSTGDTVVVNGWNIETWPLTR